MERTTIPSMTHFRIKRMHCASCVNKIETALQAVVGVDKATVNFVDHSASVTGMADTKQLLKAIAAVGYSAEVVVSIDSQPTERTQKEYYYLIIKFIVAADIPH